jgi:hypothetical protein
LGAKAAAALDQELMSTCAFSIDQLMELAGLSVSQAGKDQAKGCVAGTNIPTTKYSGSIPLRRVLGFWLLVALGITVGVKFPC